MKDNNKNIIQESYYSKINFKVKYTRAKDFLNEVNCKQPLISNTYMEEDIQNYLSTVMFRGTPCIYGPII